MRLLLFLYNLRMRVVNDNACLLFLFVRRKNTNRLAGAEQVRVRVECRDEERKDGPRGGA